MSSFEYDSTRPFWAAAEVAAPPDTSGFWNGIGRCLGLFHSCADSNRHERPWDICYDSAHYRALLPAFQPLLTSGYAELSSAVNTVCGYAFEHVRGEHDFGLIHGEISLLSFQYDAPHFSLVGHPPAGYGSRALDLAPLLRQISSTAALDQFLQGYTAIRGLNTTFLDLLCHTFLSEFSYLSKQISSWGREQAVVANFLDNWCGALQENRLFALKHLDTETLSKYGLTVF